MPGSITQTFATNAVYIRRVLTRNQIAMRIRSYAR